MKAWNDKLYCRGFLLTSNKEVRCKTKDLNWDKWKCSKLLAYELYVHEEESFFAFYSKDKVFLLIGHAYNPFTLEIDENIILENLASLYSDEKAYRDYFDQLTGVFSYYVIENNCITVICDCAGMMGSYYGIIDGELYFSSHAQMIADFTSLEEDPYVTSLKRSKTFHLYGIYLPADYSPYSKIKRVLPNVEVKISGEEVCFNRFYPRTQYFVEENYDNTVRKVGELLHNNMILISQKWNHPAISLTGGTDSKTTLACAGDVQNKFLYYSYISLPREGTDAYAAQKICKELGLMHEIYNIDSDPSHHPEYNEVDAIIERHYGYLGKANKNDVCKRIDLIKQFHSDIEVKSWVSEVARASRYTKYHKNKLPKVMTPRILTSMYKIFTYDRWNALRTDKVFKQYLEKTDLQNAILKTRYPWSEFFVWENVFGGWGGLTLSCEHKVSNNITVPYNNRAILDLMLRTPLEKRKTDQLHSDIIELMDARINRLGIHVVNGNETKRREILEGLYFDLHTHLPF